ncbi:MAG TPA: protein kinase [Pseudomonadota bacterium]|nr:protein kinase [Pseudomonadota bacterium]
MSASIAALAKQFSLQGAVILLIDDNPATAKYLHLVLQIAGAQVIGAESIAAAWERLTEQTPHVILLDIVLPDGDGIMLCKELKNHDRLKNIPILFITGVSDTEDKVQAYIAGGADYIVKPFIPAEVLARVSHHYRMACANRILQMEKEELSRRNIQLQQARQETSNVFSALADQLLGKTLDGKYLLQERIGTGGFAVVYRALHSPLSRQVAVKVLHPFEQRRRAQRLHRFRQEITAAALVQHPNVVEIIDAQVSGDGLPYLVMELLTGHSLSEELQPGTPLPLRRCLDLGIAMSDVLVMAERVGVLHRDIKPSNIFIHQGPAGPTPKLLDFGLAKVLQEDSGQRGQITQRGDLAGTLLYMSPEQLSGDATDPRTDIYSLGVTLYELCTGQSPGEGSSESLLAALRNQMVQPREPPSRINPRLPPELDAVLLRTLNQQASQRPSAAELLQALRKLAASLPDPR